MAENAKVKAGIHGDRIIVAGKITGDIQATQSVSVIAPAIIQGNITTPLLSVGEGAVIEGKISMLNVRTSSDAPDTTMTLRDVAQYLEVEARVVEEWASKKRIPARQEGGDWIFSKASVDRWIQEENSRV